MNRCVIPQPGITDQRKPVLPDIVREREATTEDAVENDLASITEPKANAQPTQDFGGPRSHGSICGGTCAAPGASFSMTRAWSLFVTRIFGASPISGLHVGHRAAPPDSSGVVAVFDRGCGVSHWTDQESGGRPGAIT